MYFRKKSSFRRPPSFIMAKIGSFLHVLLCLAGIGIALYSIHVESMMTSIPGYTPSCDISSWKMSCSKVFSSAYARPLSNWSLVKRGSSYDFSLPQIALMYFAPLIMLPIIARRRPGRVFLFRVLSYIAVGFNLYLAYILKFVIGEVCIVCLSNYVVNMGLLLTVDNLARAAKARSDISAIKKAA